MIDNEAEKLILVRFTNPYQIRYAKDDSGSFYPETENGRLKALYMLKRHENRLHTGEQLAPTVAAQAAEIARLKSSEKKAFWFGFERAVTNPCMNDIQAQWNDYKALTAINPTGEPK